MRSGGKNEAVFVRSPVRCSPGAGVRDVCVGVKLRDVSVVGFIAVAVRAKLLLDAYCVKSPGVLQRNISVKLVLLT